MKILHVITTMDPRAGGPCEGIRSLAPHMESQGYPMEVLCLDDPGSEYLAKETMPIHALGKSRTAFAYHPALWLGLKKRLASVDAVILHGLWQYPGYVLSRMAQFPNMPPYFVYPHGMLDPWFQRAPGRRVKAVRNWLYWKLVEQRVIHRARAVFFTCAEEMRLARETFRPYQPRREVNVGYGISQPPAFNKAMADAFVQKCPGLERQPYYLFLSRIHPKKGVDSLIRAYAALYHAQSNAASQTGRGGSQAQISPLEPHRSQFPSLVVAGPGLETDYGKAMQKLAAELCPPFSVFWPGMLTGDAKWGAYYGAEAFVLPSHQENFGIAVVESIACGTPVLITNQVNIWREIEQANAGLVAEDSSAEVENMLRRWADLSREERAAMKQNCKDLYAKHFGMSATARKLVENLQELTAEFGHVEAAS